MYYVQGFLICILAMDIREVALGTLPVQERWKAPETAQVSTCSEESKPA